MALIKYEFEDQRSLTDALTEKIIGDLRASIADRGFASLAVSGGSTPKPLFAALSLSTEIDWSKVTVLLVDERWVSDDSDASNQTLVKQHLLQNHAANAQYVSIKDLSQTPTDAVTSLSLKVKSLLPIDVVILGMGTDAHTASLFPCSQELAQGIDLDNQNILIATTPTTAPHKRMSLTLKSIVDAKHCYLHITGSEKRQVLQEALANGNGMEKPIAAVAQTTELNLMWAP